MAKTIKTAALISTAATILAAALCQWFPLSFLLTSLAAACFDLLFVIMQRYNRPRILRIIDKKK